MNYIKTRSTKLKSFAAGLTTLVVVGLVFAAGPSSTFTQHAFADNTDSTVVATATPAVSTDSTDQDTSTTTGIDDATVVDVATSSDVVVATSSDPVATSTTGSVATDTPDVVVATSSDPDTQLSGQTCNFASNVNTDSSMDDPADDVATSTLVSPINPAWTATTTNPNAKWIWGDVLTDGEAQAGSSDSFTQRFWVTGTPTGTLQLAADNNYTVTVNGTTIDTSNQDPGGNNFSTSHAYDISADLLAGQVNTLTITVTNTAVPGSTALSNPAGLLFGLKVSGSSCSGVAKVYVHKFIQTSNEDGGTKISQVPNNSNFPDFPMTATWTAPNLNGGVQSSGNYPLGEYFGGSENKFVARTAYMAFPYSYTSTEITGANSPVVANVDDCSPGKFYLVGYKTGTNIADAENQPTTQDPEFTNADGHGAEIVINAQCPAAPKECTLVSDTGTLTNTGHGDGHQPAVLVSAPLNALWTAVVNGASWIWGTNPTSQHDLIKGGSETFTKTFNLDATTTTDATLTLAADNYFSAYVNGHLVGGNTNEDNYSSSTVIDVPAADLVKGSNKLTVTVTNLGQAGGTQATNPAGLLYNLTITGAECRTGNGGGGKTGTLTVVKHTVGGDGTFNFDLAPQGIQEEVAQTQPSVLSVTTSDGSGATSTQVTPGNYTLSEEGQDGWTLTGTPSCVDTTTGSTTPIDDGQAVTIPAGDTVTCTFTNTSNGSGGGGPTNTYSTTTVQSANLSSDGSGTGQNGWFFYNDTSNVIDNTLGSFVTGPATPPLGTGSVEMTLGDTPNDRKDIATAQYGGTPLSNITELTYASYSHSGPGVLADESPYLLFDVDFTGTSTAYQSRLVYVPRNNGAVPQDQWNQNDAIKGGNAEWVYSGTNWPATSVGPDAGVTTPGSTPRSWSAILADYPSARILTPGLLGVRVGEPGPTGYTGDVDDFAIGIEDSGHTTINTTTYDFEPTAISNDGGGTSGGSSGGGTGGSTSGQFSGGGLSAGLHPQVLGVSTTTVPQGQVLGATCAPILTSYLREGRKNPVDQVQILQNFLNGNLGISLPITGFFGPATFNAVSAFQKKYSTLVLAPWVPFGLHSANDPTGYVYKTTKYEINSLACPTNGAPTPSLP